MKLENDGLDASQKSVIKSTMITLKLIVGNRTKQAYTSKISYQKYTA